jgi:putative nucleotidyltransferase with HDIG domain
MDHHGPGLDLSAFRRGAGEGPPTGGPPAGQASPAASPALVLREQRLRAVLSGIDGLPSLPTVVVQILRLAGDRHAGASDFEELVRRDQALAAKVLKLVNSPFFGLRGKVTSITQAVVVLGLKTLKSVVLAAKTGKLLQRETPQYGFAAGGMWRHSVSAASLGSLVARKAGLDAEAWEELFVAGLLHDAGKVVLAPHLAAVRDEFAAALARAGGDVCRAEEETLGLSHAAVGGRMAERWGLDPSLKRLIEEHHCDDPSAPAALLALRVADDLCHQLGVGRADGPRDPHPGFAAWARGLDLGDPSSLRDEAAAHLDHLEPMLAELAGE